MSEIPQNRPHVNVSGKTLFLKNADTNRARILTVHFENPPKKIQHVMGREIRTSALVFLFLLVTTQEKVHCVKSNIGAITLSVH